VTLGAICFNSSGHFALRLVVLTANSENDFDAAFARMAQQRAGGLLVCASHFSIADMNG